METLEKFIQPIEELKKKLHNNIIPFEVEKHFDGLIIYMPCKKYRYCDVVLDNQSYGNENFNFEYCFATFNDISSSDNIVPNLSADEVVDKFKARYIDFNKWLIEEFPFLLPKNRFTGQVVEDYDYSHTELDALPRGWYINFGVDICREIKNALLECQMKNPTGGYDNWDDDSGKKIPYLEGYTISQIKEKYGRLHWYDFGAPQSVLDIISKYEKISSEICIECGKPAKYETRGWITFICEDCAKKFKEESLIKLGEENERD